jgi:quinol monooxygenase YgiN
VIAGAEGAAAVPAQGGGAATVGKHRDKERLMYIVRTEGMVTPGRRVEYTAWLDRLFDFLQGQPGLQAITVTNSAGYPAKFTGITRWENKSAHLNMIDSPRWTHFLQQHPLEGLITPTRPVDAWETIQFQRGPANLGTLVSAEVALDQRPGLVRTFEQRCQRLLELVQQHGRGVVVTTLLRCLAGDGRYLIGYGFITVEDGQATFEHPEIARFRAEHPLTMFTSQPVAIEVADVVKTAVLAPVR